MANLQEEVAAKQREIEDLKKAVDSRDKTIEDLKKTLTIHVDKQIVKNTTRTESHVSFANPRKPRSKTR